MNRDVQDRQDKKDVIQELHNKKIKYPVHSVYPVYSLYLCKRLYSSLGFPKLINKPTSTPVALR